MGMRPVGFQFSHDCLGISGARNHNFGHRFAQLNKINFRFMANHLFITPFRRDNQKLLSEWRI